MIVVVGGKGGLSTKNALLHIISEVGSTITLSKDGVIVKVMDASKSHVNAQDNTLADWFYSVSQSNFGEWSISAELNSIVGTQSVTVDAAKEYEIFVGNRRYLFREGYGLESGLTVRAISGSCNVSASEIYAPTGIKVIDPTIDLTQYQSIVFECNSTNHGYLYAGSTVGYYTSDTSNASFTSSVSVPTSRGIKSIDITNVSGSYYIKFYQNDCILHVYNLYLERSKR